MNAGRRPRVAVTRPEDGAAELARLLEAAGAEPVMFPLTRIVPVPDSSELRSALAALDRYDWIIFTSANAVRAVAAELPSGAAPHNVPAVAAVGTSTADAVSDLLGWTVRIVPDEFSGDALVPAMRRVAELEGRRVLWPRSARARPAIARDLSDAGAQLDAPVAYDAVPLRGNAAELVTLCRAGDVDIVTLTAPSAAACFADGDPPPGAVCAVLGTTTAESARERGLAVRIQPSEHTLAALVEAVLEYWGRREQIS